MYVVTAAHVIAPAQEIGEPVTIKFYEDHSDHQGQIIRYFEQEDIALLEVKRPPNYLWDKNCLGKAKLGADVAFIGRGDKWYIPYGRSLGRIHDLDYNEIQVDITSVVPTTSGAPLISRSGIIGMIIKTDGVSTVSVHIDQIRKMLSDYNHFFTLSDNFVSDTEGNRYPTSILEDNKRWMTANLNLRVEDSWCYDEKSANCSKYGRMYTWQGAKEACSLLGEGWHLPRDEEWRRMTEKYGGSDDYARDGGSAAYLSLSENSQNGFSALLGGFRYSKGTFHHLGSDGMYWTSTEIGRSGAIHYNFKRNEAKLFRDDDQKGIGISVRCVWGH